MAVKNKNFFMLWRAIALKASFLIFYSHFKLIHFSYSNLADIDHAFKELFGIDTIYFCGPAFSVSFNLNPIAVSVVLELAEIIEIIAVAVFTSADCIHIFFINDSHFHSGFIIAVHQ